MTVLGVAALAIGRSGVAGRFIENRRCCQLSVLASLRVAAAETLSRASYPSEIGQDKWVLERVFPEVTDGFFVDVGSGHGTIGLEQPRSRAPRMDRAVRGPISG